MSDETKDTTMKIVDDSKDEASNVPAVPVTPSLDNVPEMLDFVTAQIKDIKKDIPSGPKTTGTLNGFGKIADIDSVETLIKAAATVRMKQKAYNDAATELISDDSKIKVPKCKINGSDAENWIADIKSRIVLVANKEKLARLNKVKSTLEENLSREAKFERDMKKVFDIIKEESDD